MARFYPTNVIILILIYLQFPKGEAERLQHFLDLCDKYGNKGYIRLWSVLFKPIIVICGPDSMKRILKTAGSLQVDESNLCWVMILIQWCVGFCALKQKSLKYVYKAVT